MAQWADLGLAQPSTTQMVVGESVTSSISVHLSIDLAGNVRTDHRAVHLQGRSKEEQNLQALKGLTTASRRDAMLCLTGASLSGVTLFSTEPVEARTVKPETRRKIMEKLKMLREKARLSEPKTEDKEMRPPPQSSPKELPPLPNPLKDPAESLVEAILP
ncbi:hypothetical protein F0562_032605 [Nyssa sinensis]|uniref:Uncharacterized protein n=1 Tax=Nyssa sinensis TaxID=561372 RepID=A0A5J5AQM9_9ASTE|nr:hypothetical protein F0562_032605 [Nyssa sinensis]